MVCGSGFGVQEDEGRPHPEAALGDGDSGALQESGVVHNLKTPAI